MKPFGSIVRRSVAAGLLACLSGAVAGTANADDYVRDVASSGTAKAFFSAVRKDLQPTRVARNEASTDGENGAYFTDDGSISIPPGAMVSFKMAGRCMDPHLPAPFVGEPMQFVDVGKLVPVRLRGMYDNLILRQSQHDPKVMANNPQHLVWAIRTAGTEDPLANSLSESQLEVLDECAGRRGAFMKYHEKEKRRNARRNKKRGIVSGGNRISVGALSYDAAELSGTNGMRRIEAHIGALTEMGEKSKVRTEADFRYGEIEDELYSDIACNGGLSFTARLLNASERRKEFRAADFAAQVGNGNAKGGMRQRVTMGTPDEFMFVAGALREGVEIERDASIVETEGEVTQRLRGRAYRRRTARTGEGHARQTRETERTRRVKSEARTTITEVPPVPPVPPIEIHDVVTNEIVRTVAEQVKVRAISLAYDSETRKGLLTVEIVSGSFTKASRYIRKNFDELVRTQSPAGGTAEVPSDALLEIGSIGINDQDYCEITFTAKTEGKNET
ncbi:MAG: hypothetical protein ACI4RA_07920 [Kiritimatiellia bacterium]